MVGQVALCLTLCVFQKHAVLGFCASELVPILLRNLFLFAICQLFIRFAGCYNRFIAVLINRIGDCLDFFNHGFDAFRRRNVIGHIIKRCFAVQVAVVRNERIIALLGCHRVSLSVYGMLELAAAIIEVHQTIKQRQTRVCDEAIILGGIDAKRS